VEQEKLAETVAIVLLSRRPLNLPLWAKYHLGYMGVNHVFMVVEDTPEFNRTWAAVPEQFRNRFTFFAEGARQADNDNRPLNDYQSLQDRQMNAMAHAKRVSKEMGIQWLVHIDDDELLYSPSHRKVGDILASVQEDLEQAYIPNFEAVFESSRVQNCFEETRQINLDKPSFVSYANGKAALRVSAKDTQPAGPHQWRDHMNRPLPSEILDSEPFGSPLIVIHFESCPVARWKEKFWELGNISPEEVQHVPFGFYKQSILRMQECGHQGILLQDKSDECSDIALDKLWSSWKTPANPRFHPDAFMPVQIPWDTIGALSAREPKISP